MADSEDKILKQLEAELGVSPEADEETAILDQLEAELAPAELPELGAPVASDPTQDPTFVAAAEEEFVPRGAGIAAFLGANREQDLLGQFMAGAREDTITGHIISAITGEQPVPSPSLTFAEDVAKFAGSVVGDPVADLIGFGAFSVVGKVAGKALSKAVQAEKFAASAVQRATTEAAEKRAAKLTAKFTKQKKAARTVLRAKQGAAAGATLVGIQAESSRFSKGEEFDAANLIMSVGGGALLGAGLGAAGSKVENLFSVDGLQRRLELRDTDLPPGLDPTAVRKVQSSYRTLVSMRKQMSKLGSQLESQELNATGRQRITEDMARLTFKQNELLADLASDATAGQLRKIQAEQAGKTVKIGGRKVPLYDQAVSDKGIVLTEDDIRFYAGQKDFGEGGIFSKVGGLAKESFTDMRRILRGMDGDNFNGKASTDIVNRVDDANASFIAESKALDSKFAELQEAAGIGRLSRLSSRAKNEASKRVFRALDGTASPEEMAKLTPEQKTFINFTRAAYSSLLDRINVERLALGRTPIKKRKNYITHIRKLKLFDEYNNIASSSGKQKNLDRAKLEVRNAFERARNKNEFDEDPVAAIGAYLPKALREIHFSRTAAEAEARLRLLPPKMRAAALNWLNSTVLGGAERGDVALRGTLRGKVAEVAADYSRRLGGAVISGNLQIVLDQFSQVTKTAADFGLLNTMRATGKAMLPAQRQLYKKSAALSGRDVNLEFGKLEGPIGKQMAKVSDMILGNADKLVLRQSWQAAFDWAQRRGISEEAAIKFADEAAISLHASYQNMWRPEFIRGTLGRAVAPFTSFAFNLANSFVFDAKAMAQLKGTGALKQRMLALSSYIATKYIYESMGAQTPFRLSSIPGAGDIMRGDVPFIAPALTAAVDEASGVARVLDERRPSSRSVAGNLFLAFTTSDEELMDQALEDAAASALVKGGFKGGLQLSNTIRGIRAAEAGELKTGEGLDDTDKVRALLFGPQKTRAREESREENKEARREALGRDE